MKKTIKKTWNKPTITQLDVSKTAGQKRNHSEARWGNKNMTDDLHKS